MERKRNLEEIQGLEWDCGGWKKVGGAERRLEWGYWRWNGVGALEPGGDTRVEWDCGGWKSVGGTGRRLEWVCWRWEDGMEDLELGGDTRAGTGV